MIDYIIKFAVSVFFAFVVIVIVAGVFYLLEGHMPTTSDMAFALVFGLLVENFNKDKGWGFKDE